MISSGMHDREANEGIKEETIVVSRRACACIPHRSVRKDKDKVKSAPGGTR